MPFPKRPHAFQFRPSRRTFLTGALATASLAGSGAVPSAAEPLNIRPGETRTLNAGFLGFDTESLAGPDWHGDFLHQITLMMPKLIRYPGGSTANYWSWKQGGPPPESIPGATGDHPFTLEMLANTLKLSGAEALIDVNMMTATLDSQLDMLVQARRLDIPIRRIELGNEFYWSKPDYVSAFATPEDYAKAANEWAKAIKQEFNDAELAVVGAFLTLRDERGRNWNQRVLANLDGGVDAMTLHTYPRPETPLNLPLNQNGDLGTETQNRERKALAAPDAIERLLAEPFREWDQELSAIVENIPDAYGIWITETNLKDSVAQLWGTWAQALFAATLFAIFIRNPRIDMAILHNLPGLARYGSIFRDEDAFKGLDDAPKTQRLALSCQGHAFIEVGTAAAGAHSVTWLEFTNARKLTASDGSQRPALFGLLFKNKLNDQGLLFNLSDKPYRVHVERKGVMQVTQLSAKPLYRATDDDAALARRYSTSSNIYLAPYSLTRVVL